MNIDKGIGLWRMKESQMLGHHAFGRDNNFNLLRMLAAIGVLVSHAYPISRGAEAQQPLEGLLGITLGTLSVLIFFRYPGSLLPRASSLAIHGNGFLWRAL